METVPNVEQTRRSPLNRLGRIVVTITGIVWVIGFWVLLWAGATLTYSAGESPRPAPELGRTMFVAVRNRGYVTMGYGRPWIVHTYYFLRDALFVSIVVLFAVGAVVFLAKKLVPAWQKGVR